MPDPSTYERQELALEAAGVGSFDWDLRTGELLFDARLAKIFGLDPEAWDSRIETVFSAVVPEDLPGLQAHLDATIAAGRDLVVSYRINHPDGDIRWISGYGRIVYDGSEPARMIGVAHDTTELQMARDRVARTVEHMADAFLLVDRDWCVRYANHHADALLDLPRDEAIGRPLWDVAPMLSGGAYGDALRHARRTGESTAYDVWVLSRQRWYEVRVHPDSEGVSIFATDVTALRQAEADRSRGVSQAELGRRVRRYTDVLSDAVTVADVCAAAATRLMPAFEASGMLISLAESGRLRVAGHAGYTAAALDRLDGLRLSRPAPVSEAMRDRVPIFVPSYEAYATSWPDMTELAQLSEKQAWAFLPLVVSRRALGALSLAFDQPHEFTTDERSILVSLAGQLAQALERARLREAEHDLARELQRTMLPTSIPQTEGLEVAVRYLPATDGIAVGGDWYDVVHLPDGQIALVVGDVQGHSVLAAAQMGQLRHALRAYAAEGHEPAAVLSRTDRLMTEIAGEAFATCLLLHLDLRAERMTVASAGHPPPVLRHADGSVSVVEIQHGLPLGVEPDDPYTAHDVPLAPGDAIMLFTDGLLEAGRRPYGDGLEALCSALADVDPQDLPEVVDSVLRRVVGDPDSVHRYDDVAVLLARFDGLAQDRRPRTAHHTVDRESPAPVGDARAFATSVLARLGLGDIADRVLLVVSELVTNAVQHGSGPVTLDITLSAQRLLVEVGDGSPVTPEPRPVDIVSTSGRGMHIIERLADAWGTRARDEGKVVWAELDLGRQRRLLSPHDR